MPLLKQRTLLITVASLDSADEINQMLGYPAGYGRVRWLAQLWPEFKVYPGSVPA
jgi:hypothetical protein